MPSFRDLKEKLRADGWYLDRQTGSHQIWKHPEKEEFVVVAGHQDFKDVPTGTYHSILKRAGLK